MRILVAALMLSACSRAAPADAVPATVREDGQVVSWGTDCPAVDAVYALDGAPGFTAGFRATPDGYQSARDHLFWIRSEDTGRTYWFGFSISTGYGGVFAIPQAGPEVLTNPADGPDGSDDGIALYPMGFDGAVGHEPPQGERADAPPLVFAPELGAVLSYNVEAYGGTERERMPRALFRLVRCGDRLVAWAPDQPLSSAAPAAD